MGSEATYTVGLGWDDPLFPPLDIDIDSFLAQIPDGCDLEDHLLLMPPDESAGNSAIAGLRDQPVLYPGGGLAGPTAVAENLPEKNAHPRYFDWTGTSPGPGLTQPATYSIIAGTGMAEPHSWSPLLGFNMREINTVINNSTAPVKDILSPENPPQEPSPLVFNAGLAMPEPEPDPYSAGDTSCPSTAANTGSSSLDQEVNAGGGALTEVPVRASCKRKKLVCGSSSQRSTPPEFNLVELEAGLVQMDPSSTDIQPPTGSTDLEIIDFLWREYESMPRGKEGEEVNLSVAEQDGMAPKAVRSYVTTVEMMPNQKMHRGYWKQKGVEVLRKSASAKISYQQKSAEEFVAGLFSYKGVKNTFQFHRYDGTKTNWFMDEYIPTNPCGVDLYLELLRFRRVYEDPENSVPEVKNKKIAATKRHRMRGPENLVIKGESPVWQHFIKIYDRHPELEGAKVVYAVCYHCEGVLKAGTDNGTKSLLNHCDRTCPVKNKNRHPRLSTG